MATHPSLAAATPSATVAAQAAAAPAPAERGFAELVDFEALYGSLETRGYRLSQEEKLKLEETVRNRLTQHDGTTLLGTNWIHVLMSFFKLFVNGNGALASPEAFGAHMSGTLTTSNHIGKLKSLHDAAGSILSDLHQQGGTLAQVAELVAGVRNSSPGDRHAARATGASVFEQVGRKAIEQHIPLTTPVLIAEMGEQPTHGLTQGATGALTRGV
jgi:hypothetical protein